MIVLARCGRVQVGRVVSATSINNIFKSSDTNPELVLGWQGPVRFRRRSRRRREGASSIRKHHHRCVHPDPSQKSSGDGLNAKTRARSRARKPAEKRRLRGRNRVVAARGAQKHGRNFPNWPSSAGRSGETKRRLRIPNADAPSQSCTGAVWSARDRSERTLIRSQQPGEGSLCQP